MSASVQYKAFSFEVKAVEAEGMLGEGHASAFYNVDGVNEIVDDAAFNNTLPEFLKSGFVGGINHNWDDPIGQPTKAVPDGKGLYVGWKLTDTAHGRDCAKLLKDGVIKKLSIGYRVLGHTNLETSDDVMAYWESKGYKPNAQDIARAQYGATLLTDLKLYEFSPVTVPANDQADITRVKVARMRVMLDDESDAEALPDDVKDVRSFEQWLRNGEGISRTKAKRIIALGKAVFLRDAGDRVEEPEQKADVPVETQEAVTPEAKAADTIESKVLPVKPDDVSEEVWAKRQLESQNAWLAFQTLKRQSTVTI